MHAVVHIGAHAGHDEEADEVVVARLHDGARLGPGGGERAIDAVEVGCMAAYPFGGVGGPSQIGH